MDRHRVLLTNLGGAVRSARKGLGWSRRDLAAHTAISERFLADIETGRANPSLIKLCELATALGTTPQDLLASIPRPVAKRSMIALLGLRGAGKSTVGQRLAAGLGCPFIELDARIEQVAGLTLSEMFELHGEAYYRRAEREVLRTLIGETPDALVLATGGGLVTEKATWELLRAHTHTVWLRARPEDHWARVVAQGDTRPMADNDQAFSHLCSILAEREKLYQEAEVTVDTSQRGIDEVVEELAARFASLGCESG